MPRRARQIRSMLWKLNAKAGGGSSRLARLILTDDLLSLDSGEQTDKGSVNQSAVLSRRAAMVEELYAKRPSAELSCERERAIRPKITTAPSTVAWGAPS